MIEELEGELMDLEDYKCVIPLEYISLSYFLHNHKKGEEYAICDNHESATAILSHESHRNTKHIVLLTDYEIEEVKKYFPSSNLNSDWVRFAPESYTGESKLQVGLGVYKHN